MKMIQRPKISVSILINFWDRKYSMRVLPSGNSKNQSEVWISISGCLYPYLSLKSVWFLRLSRMRARCFNWNSTWHYKRAESSLLFLTLFSFLWVVSWVSSWIKEENVAFYLLWVFWCSSCHILYFISMMPVLILPLEISAMKVFSLWHLLACLILLSKSLYIPLLTTSLKKNILEQLMESWKQRAISGWSLDLCS